VGVAGGTETGSIDDLAAIADLAQEFGVHFHVDAAWGGPVIFSEQHRHKIAGIERADTVTLDGHKQLYTPMGCGICFLRNPQHIDAVQKTANYIIRKDSHDLGKFTMEGSRPAVAVFLHANLKVMGVKGYGALVDRSIRMTRHMVNSLRATGAF
jgi:glutamate decarboxylase